MDYRIALTPRADKFDGMLTAQGSIITLDDATTIGSGLKVTARGR